MVFLNPSFYYAILKLLIAALTDKVDNRIPMKNKRHLANRWLPRLFITVWLAVMTFNTCWSIARQNSLYAYTAVAEPRENRIGAVQDYHQIAVQAYVWGYPLVVLSRLRKLHTLSKQGMEGIRAPINTFAHTSRLLNAKDPRDTITPNNDTLQSSAWLDLRDEPQVLRVPDMPGRFVNMRGRYHVLWFVDAYGNVFQNIGRRTTGSKSGVYVITGLNWSGPLPEGLIEIKAPTNTVWIRGHTFIDVYEDREKAVALVRKINLTPLGVFLGKAKPNTSQALTRGEVLLNPRDIPSAGLRFFDEMCEALKDNPPPLNETQLLKQFETVGLGSGRIPSAEVKDSAVLAALQSAAATGERLISERLNNLGPKVNGWEYTLQSGVYGNDYLLRAAIAKVGPGANVPQEITASLTRHDQDGQQLIGEHKYIIHIDKAHIPPVDAFWSLTLYSSTDSFFVDNPINRYSIGDLTKGLVMNSDGSMDIYIQRQPPGDSGQRPNWLPAPKGEFYLVFRTYQPRAEIFDGRYEFPPVQRVGKK
jgi:hypothetical protein